jgi:hypothetical protein
MRQLVLLFALQLLGSCACLASGLPATWLCHALGFLVGLALAVVLALPGLLLGHFTVPIMAGVLAAALIGMVCAAVSRGRMTPRTALTTVIWALVFTAACVPFVVEDLSVMTYDSHGFVSYAATLRDSHESRSTYRPPLARDLPSWDMRCRCSPAI